ncbi:solute carrier family 46 member 3-like [Mizuhopecten yessoensis]|uniref:Solute carrier family 46 member 3 n=1 Tax=Mizuhopecten yessoensis TaxID=6573 RepID=A0A210QE48_MIZYE|nr:solute carrier family 46 member 3-like [Mizuhopecten yessoensis]OWF47006.1 Solute carrier family 46 member 3 [Mizuhopecten yessoensis]
MSRSQTYSLQTLESKEPLPATTAENQTVTEIKSKKKFMRFLILGFTLLSLIYSFVLAQLVIVQYVYANIHKTYYPNVSFSTNESGCQLNTTSQLYRDQQTVQKMASQFIIYAELARGVPGIFGIFFYGSLSDKYGRKLFLLVPFIGNMLKCVLTTVGIYLDWNIYIFIIFFFIDGCGGGWVLAVSIVMSIVADVTEPGKTRIFVIAMTEISLGLGLVIGSFTSGFIIKAEGFMYALLISSCCSILPFLLLVFVPETLNKTEDQQRKSTTQLAFDIFVFYFRDAALNGKRKIFLVCMLIYCFVITASFGANGIETLFGLNSPFCMSSVQVGVFITMRTGIPFVLGMLLFRPLQLCLDESLIAVIANLSHSAGYILEAFAYSTLMLYFVPVLSFARTMAIPIVRGIMSSLTPQEKQGTMFAGIAIVETFCTQFGSLTSTVVYGHTVETFRGAAFLVLAGYTSVAGVLSFVLYRITRRVKMHL